MLKPATTQRSSRTFLIAVCIFAFVLRVSVMFALSSYRVVEDDTNHFGFGWEMGRVAASLAQGNGFSSPLPLPTGPTAIVGPLFPLMLALIFKVFGVYSMGSSIAIHVVQCVFSSLTCLFIYLCGRDSVGEASGKLAAVLWAVFPLNIFFTVTKIWETSLTGMLTAALFWYMLRTRDSVSVPRWALAGALLAIASLINTSLVMLSIPFGLWALWKKRTRVILPVTVGVLMCAAVVSPWLIRNHAEFGKFMLRSNFPLEFRVANNEWSFGQKVEALHPSNTLPVNQHWQNVGESQFMAEQSAANAKFVATHFSMFAFATLNRIVYYWTGAWIKPSADFPNSLPIILATSVLSLVGLLGIWQMFSDKNPAAFMFAGCLLIYPIVYYVTTSQPRFYHAITPLLILSAANWIVNCRDKVLDSQASRAHRDRGLAQVP